MAKRGAATPEIQPPPKPPAADTVVAVIEQFLEWCQRMPADALNDQVVRWFFEALAVAEIDLSARVLAEGDQAREGVLAARRQEVVRLQYQARLADRQFQRSDPDNRLVTAELERRWEGSAACLPRGRGAPSRGRDSGSVLGHSR